jgi:dynein intermediate chain 1, axonemal
VISDFKYYEDPADQFKEKEGTLLPLWKFVTDITKNMCITSITWNQQYQDLFAITIGSCEINNYS